MKTQFTKNTAIFLITIALSSFVQAGESKLSMESAQALVQPFYDLLSGKGTIESTKKSFTPDWKSYASETNFKEISPEIFKNGM